MEGLAAEGTGLPVVGDEIAGKYRIEGVLGQGGMGAVFVARNALTGKRVAIKWLLPEHKASVTRERLLREAQIAASIDHPNVVDIYDVGEHQDGLFLVMEYLRGRSLAEVMAERGRLDPAELIALLVPAMRGVHAAHLAGVIHRDLKPDNIILSESDGHIVPKVLDFGVSKTNGASAVPNSSLTRTGALVGTPHYMALEQVDGSNAIDARTDVYAFGVLLYRALTGHFPFDGTSLGEVILKIGTKEASPMRLLRPELPGGLDAVVLRALNRDRQKRFADLEELARALMPYADELTSTHGGVTPGAVSFRSLGLKSLSDTTTSETGATSLAQVTGPAHPQARRRAALTGAIVVVALIALGVVLTQREDEGAEASAPAPSEANVQRELAEEQPEAVRPMSTGAAMPEEEPQVALEPPQEAEPTAQPPVAAAQVKPVAEEVRTSRPAPVAASPARQSSPNRMKHARPVVPARKSGAPALIPGERTNGLSVDEF